MDIDLYADVVDDDALPPPRSDVRQVVEYDADDSYYHFGLRLEYIDEADDVDGPAAVV